MSSSRRALLSGLARLARVGGQQASNASSSVANLAVNETSSLVSRVRIPALSRGFAAQPAVDSSSGKVTQVRCSPCPKVAILEKTGDLMNWENLAFSRGDPTLVCSYVVITAVFVAIMRVAHVDADGFASDRLESESVQLVSALSPFLPTVRCHRSFPPSVATARVASRRLDPCLVAYPSFRSFDHSIR